jgi:hypothetical protein
LIINNIPALFPHLPLPLFLLLKFSLPSRQGVCGKHWLHANPRSYAPLTFFLSAESKAPARFVRTGQPVSWRSSAHTAICKCLPHLALRAIRNRSVRASILHLFDSKSDVSFARRFWALPSIFTGNRDKNNCNQLI